MIAQVTIYIHSVFYVIAIKRDGRTSDGAHERILKQPNIIVVNINVRKDVFHNHVQGFTCLQHLIDTLTLMPFDDIFLRLRLFAVDVLRYRFVYRNGKH